MIAYWLIVAHLFGDYVLQSHTMATRKTTSWAWALVHAFVYSQPFVVLLWAHGADILLPWLVIAGTHAVIDRYRLAAYWCRGFGVGYPGIWHRGPGFVAPPPFLGVWLLILVDNAMHLAINGAVVAWVLR